MTLKPWICCSLLVGNWLARLEATSARSAGSKQQTTSQLLHRHESPDRANDRFPALGKSVQGPMQPDGNPDNGRSTFDVIGVQRARRVGRQLIEGAVVGR
jgi:hypothetical protein